MNDSSQSIIVCNELSHSYSPFRSRNTETYPTNSFYNFHLAWTFDAIWHKRFLRSMNRASIHSILFLLPFIHKNISVHLSTRIFSVWFMAGIAIFGNIMVLLGRCLMRSKRHHNIEHDLFLKNLAASDLLMGVYLAIIAFTDINYRYIVALRLL